MKKQVLIAIFACLFGFSAIQACEFELEYRYCKADLEELIKQMHDDGYSFPIPFRQWHGKAEDVFAVRPVFNNGKLELQPVSEDEMPPHPLKNSQTGDFISWIAKTQIKKEQKEQPSDRLKELMEMAGGIEEIEKERERELSFIAEDDGIIKQSNKKDDNDDSRDFNVAHSLPVKYFLLGAVSYSPTLIAEKETGTELLTVGEHTLKCRRIEVRILNFDFIGIMEMVCTVWIADELPLGGLAKVGGEMRLYQELDDDDNEDDDNDNDDNDNEGRLFRVMNEEPIILEITATLNNYGKKE